MSVNGRLSCYRTQYDDCSFHWYDSGRGSQANNFTKSLGGCYLIRPSLRPGILRCHPRRYMVCGDPYHFSDRLLGNATLAVHRSGTERLSGPHSTCGCGGSRRIAVGSGDAALDIRGAGSLWRDSIESADGCALPRTDPPDVPAHHRRRRRRGPPRRTPFPTLPAPREVQVRLKGAWVGPGTMISTSSATCHPSSRMPVRRRDSTGTSGRSRKPSRGRSSG
jgi:hypothetical protein